nr:lytic transglycosylase domain-containing protein [uncultured Anaerocolumna sp.]
MTYGRKVIKSKRRYINQNKFVVYSLIVIAIGIVIGIIASSVFWTMKVRDYEPVQKAKLEAELKENIQKYGTYDGKVFTKELINWSSGLEFIPLNCDMDEDLQEFIFYLSNAYNIDFTFVMAQIQKESSFKANAVSSTGDYGLMQINRINHEWLQEILGITDFLDPEQNITAGMYVLRQLFEKYEEPSLVLMAYNMGENGAKRLWKKDIYETSYTKDIYEIQDEFSDYLKERQEKDND